MLTKLEAVNIVLDSIGETPVSSLTSGLPDAESAEAKLDEVTTEVLAKGWHQNTNYGVKAMRNYLNKIVIPSNYIRLDTVGEHKDINVTIRTDNNVRYLFNIKEQTYIFDKDLYVDVIIKLPFAELTPSMQLYIARKAARSFQESAMGSAALDSFTVRSEAEAYAALMDSEAEVEDNNILQQSTHCHRATRRYNVLSGI
mgnify:FL=1|tara:strand:+ start:3584 stop:4180 length:597 start_codon:yes stop_codon:yes gene_type:complete